MSYANARVRPPAAENNADLRAWRGYLNVMNLIPHKHAAFIRNQKGGMKSLESQGNNQTLSWTFMGRMMFPAAISGLCSNQNGYPPQFSERLNCSHFQVGMIVVLNWSLFRKRWVQQGVPNRYFPGDLFPPFFEPTHFSPSPR